jgi:hypothetical protein
MKICNKIIPALAFAALFGARLQASTWTFEDTTLQGTFSGMATVTGFITLNGSNFGLPISITLNGPFGTFTDLGSTLQLGEGDSNFTDTYVTPMDLSQALSTPGLTVDPLTQFVFTSAFPGSTVTDTYSLISGSLVLTPEPGTASAMLIGMLAIGAAVRRKSRRI